LLDVIVIGKGAHETYNLFVDYREMVKTLESPSLRTIEDNWDDLMEDNWNTTQGVQGMLENAAHYNDRLNDAEGVEKLKVRQDMLNSMLPKRNKRQDDSDEE